MSKLLKLAVGSLVLGLVVLGLKALAYVLTGSVAFYSDALALDETNVYIISGGFLWKKAKAGGPLICLAVTKTGSGANMVVDATNVYWPDQQTQRIMKVAK